MGIGGWLTNYKRFNLLPKDKSFKGDLSQYGKSWRIASRDLHEHIRERLAYHLNR
jgi:hypothetical protein